jgi:ATP-binding cassette subfamily C protein LapB
LAVKVNPDGGGQNLNSAQYNQKIRPEIDPLLECVKYIAGHYERPNSNEILLAGLASGNSAISLQEAERIFDHIGLEYRREKFDPGAAKLTDFPAIAWTVEGRPVVLTEMNEAGKVLIWVPESRTISPASGTEDISGSDVMRFQPTLGQFEQKAGVAGRDWLLRLVSEHWRAYSYIILATTIVNMLALASPLFTMNVYDRVLPNKAFSTLIVLAAGTTVALAFDLMLRNARSMLVDSVATQLDIKIAWRLFEKLLNAPVNRLTPSTGWMSSRLSEYEHVRDFIGSTTVIYFVDFFFSTIFIFVLAMISVYIAVIPVVFALALIALSFWVQRKVGSDVHRSDRASAHRHALMAEIVAGLDTIKAARAEGVFLRRWNDVSVVSVNASSSVKASMALVSNASYFLQTACTIVIVVVGAFLFDDGSVTMGGIIAAVILGGRIIGPMGQIALMGARVRQAISAYANLSSIMALPDERHDPRSRVFRAVTGADIQFNDVEFRYAADQAPVLKNFNLKIAQGERVAILGRMGSGKTTIGRLLVRLYEPTSGVIRVGNVDVSAYHSHELRRAIGFATNDALIFDGSFRENITIADPTAADAAIIKAATIVGVDAIIQQFKAGYETLVGERGRQLSSGQRQALV